MKRIFLNTFVAIMAFGLVSCDNSVEYLNINNEVPPAIEVSDACEFRNAIRAVLAGLHTYEYVSFSDVEKLVYQKFGTVEFERAIYQRFGVTEASRGIALRSASDVYELTISDNAFLVADRFAVVEPTNFSTHTEYFRALDGVLASNRYVLTELEYELLSISLMINADIVYVMLDDELIPIDPDGFRNWGNWWTSWGRCTFAIVGATGTGVLTGAVAGNAVPAIGVIPGAIIGGIAAGASAAANLTACNPGPPLLLLLLLEW